MPVFNEQVKRPYEEYNYTIEEIKELKKCKDDIFYFMKYVKIIHPDLGRIVYEPYDFQKELINLILDNSDVVCLVSRQMGKCTHYNTPIEIRKKGSSDIKRVKIGELFDTIQ